MARGRGSGGSPLRRRLARLRILGAVVPHLFQRNLGHIHVDALLPDVLLLEVIDGKALEELLCAGELHHILAGLVAAERVVFDAFFERDFVGQDCLLVRLWEAVDDDVAGLGRQFLALAVDMGLGVDRRLLGLEGLVFLPLLPPIEEGEGNAYAADGPPDIHEALILELLVVFDAVREIEILCGLGKYKLLRFGLVLVEPLDDVFRLTGTYPEKVIHSIVELLDDRVPPATDVTFAKPLTRIVVLAIARRVDIYSAAVNGIVATRASDLDAERKGLALDGDIGLDR